MASLCHQHVLYHLLVFGLRRGPVILDTHVYIVAKIFNRWLSSYISQGIGSVHIYQYCIHLSNWSLVMNLSREQCTMQDRKLPSHTSHMNLTGDGAGEAVREASRTEISVRLTRAMLRSHGLRGGRGAEIYWAEHHFFGPPLHYHSTTAVHCCGTESLLLLAGKAVWMLSCSRGCVLLRIATTTTKQLGNGTDHYPRS